MQYPDPSKIRSIFRKKLLTFQESILILSGDQIIPYDNSLIIKINTKSMLDLPLNPYNKMVFWQFTPASPLNNVIEYILKGDR